MYCLKCGKEIPQQSVFCMFCGADQRTSQTNSFNQNPPLYIDEVRFWLTGPREVRERGFFKTDLVGRRIGFSFCLKDNENNYTTSNGLVYIAVADGAKPEPKGYVENLKHNSHFFGAYDITLNDFKWNGYQLKISIIDSEMIFCPQTAYPCNYGFYCAFQPVKGNLIIWNPAWQNREQINWE